MDIIENLNKLAGIAGTKNKKLHLSLLHRTHGEVVKDVLVAAYDPFIRYGSANNAAVYLASQHIPVDKELAHRVFKKDLRIGMGAKTINAIWPGLIPTHDVMLAKPVDWDRVKYPCWSTLKLDGVRAIYRKGKFHFRNGKEIKGLQHLTRELEGAPILDGELLCPELNFQQSSGQIRSYAASPTAEFHVFEVPQSKEPFLADRIHEASGWVSSLIHMIALSSGYNQEHILRKYEEAIKFGFEGLVIKPFKYDYVGKRSWDWMKIKATETEDLYVKDIFEGTGKYTGMLGGVIIDRSGVDVRVGSGFSDEQRYRFWVDPDSILGRCIEVQYHEVTPGGSLRHPRFIRFRDDKDME